MVAAEKIYAALNEIFRELFGDETISLNPGTTARDIAGWDSVKMVIIILAVEARFGVKFRSREIDQLNSVGDLADLVGTKLAK
jgi:acyl carrier protein